MEEIESAIYSLKEAIEQHFGTDTGQLAHIGPDNMHDTLKKMNKSLESAIDTADRKSTRLDFRHLVISYCGFFLEKKKIMFVMIG